MQVVCIWHAAVANTKARTPGAKLSESFSAMPSRRYTACTHAITNYHWQLMTPALAGALKLATSLARPYDVVCRRVFHPASLAVVVSLASAVAPAAACFCCCFQGVDAFGTAGYHGYWPSDLYKVNPAFGSQEQLLDVVQTYQHSEQGTQHL